MTSSFRITPRALKDIHNIGRYTARQWGRTQRDAYLRRLDRRFQQLADRPLTGRSRDEISAGCHSCVHEAHVIFYQICDEGIVIIGVPHQMMDIQRHLGVSDE